jgi:hypothetical protein
MTADDHLEMFKEDAVEFRRLMGTRDPWEIGPDGEEPSILRSLAGLEYVFCRLTRSADVAYGTPIMQGLMTEFAMRSKLMAGHTLRSAFGMDNHANNMDKPATWTNHPK